MNLARGLQPGAPLGLAHAAITVNPHPPHAQCRVKRVLIDDQIGSISEIEPI